MITGGTVYVIHSGQEKFKKKYGVGYHDFGEYLECSYRDMRAYNEVIFEWLNQHYGKSGKRMSDRMSSVWANGCCIKMRFLIPR